MLRLQLKHDRTKTLQVQTLILISYCCSKKVKQLFIYLLIQFVCRTCDRTRSSELRQQAYTSLMQDDNFNHWRSALARFSAFYVPRLLHTTWVVDMPGMCRCSPNNYLLCVIFPCIGKSYKQPGCSGDKSVWGQHLEAAGGSVCVVCSWITTRITPWWLMTIRMFRIPESTLKRWSLNYTVAVFWR